MRPLFQNRRRLFLKRSFFGKHLRSLTLTQFSTWFRNSTFVAPATARSWFLEKKFAKGLVLDWSDEGSIFQSVRNARLPVLTKGKLFQWIWCWRFHSCQLVGKRMWDDFRQPHDSHGHHEDLRFYAFLGEMQGPKLDKKSRPKSKSWWVLTLKKATENSHRIVREISRRIRKTVKTAIICIFWPRVA